MRPTLTLLAAAAVLIATSAAVPIIVHPGGTSVIITAADTINGTAPPTDPQAQPSQDNAATNLMQLAFYNNYPGSGNVNVYVTGSDVSNGAVVMLLPDGSFYYPNANGATTPQPITDSVNIPLGPQGSTTTITLPDYIRSARVWSAVGTLTFDVLDNGSGGTTLVEPSQTNPNDASAAVDWGFVELDYEAASGVFANISFVDYVGLLMSLILTTGSGATQTVKGLASGAVAAICANLQSQSASDGQPWGDMCVYDGSGNALRALSPQDYISINPNAFSGYYSSYINQVWDTYTNTPLIIDTQAAAGQVSCQVSGGMLQCDGDNRGYAQPTEADIFGCNSGPFAIQPGDNAVHYAVVPRLCAAFDRTTFLISGGNVQPSVQPSSYYSTSPTNWYSKYVHDQEVDGLGYAFSYDDVTPTGDQNVAGTVSDGSPQTLTVVIGGPL